MSAPINQSKTANRIMVGGSVGIIKGTNLDCLLTGWYPAEQTWTYASSDDPTYTFTIASFDATSKYSPGMKIKLTNDGSVKYFIITAVTFDDPGSTITIYGGTDYDLADAAITSPYYSTYHSPLSFPLDKTKWTVKTSTTSDETQSTPTQNVWYNVGSRSLSVPIGLWNLGYEVCITGTSNASQTSLRVASTLSTANNSASDTEYSSFVGFNCASSTPKIFSMSSKFKVLTIASKTSYYLNISTSLTTMAEIRTAGSVSDTIVKAVCAYL